MTDSSKSACLWGRHAWLNFKTFRTKIPAVIWIYIWGCADKSS